MKGKPRSQLTWDEISLRYWQKQLKRANQWLDAPPKNKPKSERSIAKWTLRKKVAEANVVAQVQRLLER